MIQYTLQRLLVSLASILVLAVVVFFLLRVLPGDVTVLLLGEDGYTQAGAAELRANLGLDRSLPEQFVAWVSGMARGDFGESLISGRPVARDLLVRFLRTAELVVLALPIACVVGIVLGTAAAWGRGPAEYAVGLVAVLGISAPSFVIASLLILVFSLNLGWLPSGGFLPFADDPGKHLSQLVLPVATLALAPIAVVARMTRSTMRDVLSADYLRTAAAKGVRRASLLFRHAMRNALLPVLTVVGLEAGSLLAGAVVVETIFAWPGMGLFLIDGVLKRDLPIVQTALLFASCIFVVVNLVVDLLYAVVDPRIRLG